MKIRNPKHEIRNKSKMQISNIQNVFEFSKFDIISNFDIRILNFPTEGRSYA